MYRLLSASKDTYIQNKYIAGSQSLNSNVGNAGTLDLFKLYNQTFVSAGLNTTELSRLLVQFDYSPITALTASGINIANSSFKCYFQLKDVYGGQTTPSNFTIRLAPLSQSWDEGRGFDVVAFRDLDTANFLTASVASGAPSLWVVSGAAASGSLGQTIDIITSGNVGSGNQDLTVSQLFSRGDEDLYMDVTTLVSASVAGVIPNNGWRLSFIDSQENDTTTRFVKRFGSRHTLNKELHPRLIVKYNDAITDDTADPEFNSAQNLFTYNRVNGVYQNFVSGTTSITGSNSLILRLIASKSITFTTSGYSISHSASINYLTRSLYVITQSFSASQFVLNGFAQTGIYSSSVNLNLASNTTVQAFMSGANSQKFRLEWVSTDGTYPYTAQTYTTFKKPLGTGTNALERNYVTNITNLKQVYNTNEVAKLRVFVLDYNTEAVATRVPTSTTSLILNNVKWRVIKAFSKEVVVPFDNSATLCSTDSDGMYFTFYMNDLDPGEVYDFELMITEAGQDFYITDAGYRFKVMSA